LHAAPDERNSWRLIGGGRGIHWPELDEDISVARLLRAHWQRSMLRIGQTRTLPRAPGRTRGCSL
jgi:hypothetical protein